MSIEIWRITDLKTNSFVRTCLNEDRFLGLSLLIDSGVELDPIEITADGRVIDGRHRIEAHLLSHKSDIRCEAVDLKDETEIIARAYKANCGGALPPTRADTEHTIRQLIERGVQHRKVAEALDLPYQMVRTFLKEIDRKITHNKILLAAAAMSSQDMSPSVAARTFGVDLQKLKDFLRIGQQRAKKNAAFEPRRDLTKLFKSRGASQAGILKKVMEAHDDGTFTARQVEETLDHIEGSIKQMSRSVAEWRARFNARVKPPESH